MKIKKDKNNIKIHTEESSKAVNKSLKDLGAGRSILIDADNTLIGGEGVMDEAEKLGIKVRIIDSDGSELIAVRRTDLKYSDPKRKALALAEAKVQECEDKLEDLASEPHNVWWNVQKLNSKKDKDLAIARKHIEDSIADIIFERSNMTEEDLKIEKGQLDGGRKVADKIKKEQNA